MDDQTKMVYDYVVFKQWRRQHRQTSGVGVHVARIICLAGVYLTPRLVCFGSEILSLFGWTENWLISAGAECPSGPAAPKALPDVRLVQQN
jgi:hypothetical protein